MVVITSRFALGTFVGEYGEKGEDSSSSMRHLSCRRFSLDHIRFATNNFDESLVIGEGGFGKVYKGIIDPGAHPVAIKRLSFGRSSQGETEFQKELELLSKLRHRYLVSLIGYCEARPEMIIVYEYMPGGTLSDHLHEKKRLKGGRSPLSWVRRLNICIDAARGLDYLHTGTGIKGRVIHRDVKSSNILLDENFSAKISGFGLSLIAPVDSWSTDSDYTGHIKGTFGYMDPEYFCTGRVTRKSDVYAFGVVLFEALCGRPAVDLSLQDDEQHGLAGWAKKCVREGTINKIIDPFIRGEILPGCLDVFVQIAEECLHDQSANRPTMACVVAKLDTALALQEGREILQVANPTTSHPGALHEKNTKRTRKMPFAGKMWSFFTRKPPTVSAKSSTYQGELDRGSGSNIYIPRRDMDEVSTFKSDFSTIRAATEDSSKGIFPDVQEFVKDSVKWGPTEGAIIGLAFLEAKVFVGDLTKRAIYFKFILLEFKATLDSLEPFIVEIMRAGFDQILSQEMSSQLLDILNEIKPVVEKCVDNKVSFWKKPKYMKKLQNLDKKLRGFFELNVQAKLLVDTKASWDKPKESERRFDEMIELFLNSKRLSPPELQPDDKIVGLEKPIEDLKNMVFEDDSCGPVVITAPLGSGKTTLATMFCHDPEIQEKFGKDIIFATVSSKPALKSLNKLANTIKEIIYSPTLLVLDDVWLQWEKIIKDFNFKKPGYKILVTSRFSFPTHDDRIRVYKLEKLNENVARTVLCNAAFPYGKPHNLDADDLVKEIVQRYRASPLALKLIGASLKGQPKVSWKAKVHEWFKGGSVIDSNDIGDVVKTILDSLNTEEKECYLDLGSFLEDQRIPTTALRDIWVEKYGHDEEGATTLDCLYELSTRNLINFKLLSEDVDGIEGSSNDHYVRQHDLLRELSIDCSSRDPIEERSRLIANIQENEFPHWWAQQKNLDKAELVSISTDEEFSSTWKYNLQAPKVKVLVLNSRKDYALPSFLNEMNQLRVIIITNYGLPHAQLDNTQVLTELDNLTRIRFEWFSITSIPKMANLKKLSLIMCKFGDAFADHANDMANILPKLVEFEIDQPSGLKELPNGLCNITGLKRLGITNCQDLVELPEELGKLTNLEALRLHSCTELKELPDSLCNLRNLKHLDITDCYAIDKLPERMGELSSLESLNMRRCVGQWGLKDLPTSVNNLKSLKKVLCSEVMYPLWKNIEGLTSLKIIVPEEDT